jgi:hypothetical protein
MMFKKSLYKELGKNTGKWVSNKVFGDSWSTPYRFLRSQQKVEKDTLKLEKEIEKQQAYNQLELKKLENLFVQSRNFHKKKNEIIALTLPENKEDLLTFANFLLSNAYGSGWDWDDEKEHLNALSDVCLIKLEQCEMKFKANGAVFEYMYVKKEIKNLRRRRFLEKHGMSVFVLFIFLTLILVNYLIGNFDDF